MTTFSEKQQGDVIIALTQSWRYLLGISLLAFICQFVLFASQLTNRFYLLISILLFIGSQYYIYRLWLDNLFFKLIYQHGTTSYFDESMSFLFPNKAPHMSMNLRWQGTKNLFSRALMLSSLLWLWLLISVIFI